MEENAFEKRKERFLSSWAGEVGCEARTRCQHCTKPNGRNTVHPLTSKDSCSSWERGGLAPCSEVITKPARSEALGSGPVPPTHLKSSCHRPHRGPGPPAHLKSSRRRPHGALGLPCTCWLWSPKNLGCVREWPLLTSVWCYPMYKMMTTCQHRILGAHSLGSGRA